MKKSSAANDRKAFVEFGSKQMTVKRQAELLGINRSSVYRQPVNRTTSDEELFLMRLIDEIHIAEPTWGYRTSTAILKRAYKLAINKKRVRWIMRDTGIYALL